MGRECQQGFTLMELAIVLAITAMLAAAAVPNYMTRVNQKRADTTVQDTQAIIDAARAYRSEKGSWPGDATCSNAIQALGATTPPMLAGVSNINRYNYPITTSCTQYTFSVDQNTTQDWDGVVVNGLPGSQIINSSTYQIRTTVGVPGTEPALDGKLSRLASANAEMNRMRTNLLMGNNDINEVNAVNAQTLNAAGAVNAQTSLLPEISAPPATSSSPHGCRGRGLRESGARRYDIHRCATHLPRGQVGEVGYLEPGDRKHRSIVCQLPKRLFGVRQCGESLCLQTLRP